MKQNKTYLHLGVTLIVSACAVLMLSLIHISEPTRPY